MVVVMAMSATPMVPVMRLAGAFVLFRLRVGRVMLMMFVMMVIGHDHAFRKKYHSAAKMSAMLPSETPTTSGSDASFM